MDDGWDLHAVVRSCATSTAVSSTAATENAPVARTGGTTVTSISFDDGRLAHEQPLMFSNVISFSIKPLDCEQHSIKRKSRRNKRVVEMREEKLGNDGWAWRKYGRKHIKDSPYPRNYYRCSSAKNCKARKQVERSPKDASTFVVSYSGDHLHPQPTHLISLSRTTRNTKLNLVATDLHDEQPPFSSSSPPSSVSSTTSL